MSDALLSVSKGLEQQPYWEQYFSNLIADVTNNKLWNDNQFVLPGVTDQYDASALQALLLSIDDGWNQQPQIKNRILMLSDKILRLLLDAQSRLIDIKDEVLKSDMAYKQFIINKITFEHGQLSDLSKEVRRIKNQN